MSNNLFTMQIEKQSAYERREAGFPNPVRMEQNSVNLSYNNFCYTMGYYKPVVIAFLVKFSLLILYSTVNLNAAFLQNVPQKIKQPTGETLECFATGDEFYSWLHCADGYTIIQNNETGFYVYADKVGDELVPTNLIFGIDYPQSLELQKRLILPENKIIAMRNAFEEQMQSKVALSDKQFQRKKPTDNLQAVEKRTINYIVIFIRFADGNNFGNNLNYYDSMYNTATLSVKNYFDEVSYGNLNVNFHHFPKSTTSPLKAFQTQKKRGYLLPRTAQNPDGYEGPAQGEGYTREQEIISEAIASIKSEIPTDLDLDTDNDGRIDAIGIIFQGNAQSNTPIWGHKAPNWAITETINGKQVGDYNVFPENDCSPGVMIHEFFHILGAFDLYEYNQVNPVGYWDPMGYIVNNPPHFSMHTKLKYGKWLEEIPEITESGYYTLNPVTSPTNNVYKIASPYAEQEHFIVEYRRSVEERFGAGLKPFYPEDNGLLIQKIATNSRGNLYSNDTVPFEVYIYRPNGTKTNAGDITKAAYSDEYSRTEINNNTNPRSFLHNGTQGGLDISEIQIIDTTITFKVSIPDFIITTYPENGDTYISFFDSIKWKKYGSNFATRLQISTNMNFTNIVFDENNIAENSLLMPDVLEPLTTYFWRVQPTSNTTNWSTVKSFRTSKKFYKTFISDSFEEHYAENWDTNVVSDWSIQPANYYQFGGGAHLAFPFFGDWLLATLLIEYNNSTTMTNKIPFNLDNSTSGDISIMVYRIKPSASEISSQQLDKRKDYVSLLISTTSDISQAEEIGRMPFLCANEPVADGEGWYEFVAEIPEKYLNQDFYITYKTNMDYGTSSVWGFVYLVMDHLKIIGSLEPKKFEITLLANPEEGGTLTGAGIYNDGSTQIITATGNEGFKFINWIDENDNEISTDNTLEIVLISDTILIANFIDTVGIGEEFISNFNATPNPTKDIITINMDILQAGNVDISLVDIVGCELMQIHNAFEYTETFTKTFSIETLPKGAYFLKIIHGENVRLKKIVKE